jgi:hypothetical protein
VDFDENSFVGITQPRAENPVRELSETYGTKETESSEAKSQAGKHVPVIKRSRNSTQRRKSARTLGRKETGYIWN